MNVETKMFWRAMAMAALLALIGGTVELYRWLLVDEPPPELLRQAWVGAAVERQTLPDGVREWVCGIDRWERAGNRVRAGGKMLLVYEDWTTGKRRWRGTATLGRDGARLERFELFAPAGEHDATGEEVPERWQTDGRQP